MSSSSTSGPGRACSRGLCSTQARAWSRSSATRRSRTGFARGSEAASRSSKLTLSTGRLPTEPFAVVANLPFAGSGAILSRLLRGPVTRAVVIVDWAFAQKQAAVWPTTLKSAYWRAFYELELARRLDRTAFAPPPSVDAAVMRFTRRTDPLVPTGDAQRVLAVSVSRLPRRHGSQAQRAHAASGETVGAGPRLSTDRAATRPRRVPVGGHLRRVQARGVRGTMANRPMTADDPLSTDAQPAPHQAPALAHPRRGTGRRRSPRAG